jgi:purine-cytosine permease-like protein
VRPLHVVYHDRHRRRAEYFPLVNRFGMILRGPALLASVPRYPGRLAPPRRPSVVAAYIALAGWPGGLALLGLAAGLILLTPVGPFAEFVGSLGVALVAGWLSVPLSERAQKIWSVRHAAWEQAMNEWQALRYCSRCDQVFPLRA